MRKFLTLIIIVLLSFYNTIAQVKVDYLGNVGIGITTPTSLLHLKSSTNTTLSLENGNNSFWYVGSNKLDIWGKTNTFTIYNNTSASILPFFELRPTEAFINTKLTVGTGFTEDKPAFMLANGTYMCVQAFTGSNAGILFSENTNVWKNKVDKGARIAYSESGDFLTIGTYSAGAPQYNLNIYGSKVGIRGINQDPYYEVKIWGTIWQEYAPVIGSDQQFKVDIQDLQYSSDNFKNLQGVSYYKKEFTDSTIDKKAVSDSVETYATETKKQIKEYGFLAQDVQLVYPDLVQVDQNGYLGVNYIGFIPILWEANKEQALRINDLTTITEKKTEKILYLEKYIQNLEQRITSLENNCCSITKNTGSLKSETGIEDTHDYIENTNNTLEQNVPNPWSQSTVIKVHINSNAENAMVCIYDLTGKQLKCYSNIAHGTSEVIIHAEELQPGLYLYSLLVDGNLIDTKRMVLTE